MPRPLTPEQHRLMEALMGCQLTRLGRPRKTPRFYYESVRLCIVTQKEIEDHERFKKSKLYQMLTRITEKNP